MRHVVSQCLAPGRVGPVSRCPSHVSLRVWPSPSVARGAICVRGVYACVSGRSRGLSGLHLGVREESRRDCGVRAPGSPKRRLTISQAPQRTYPKFTKHKSKFPTPMSRVGLQRALRVAAAVQWQRRFEAPALHTPLRTLVGLHAHVRLEPAPVRAHRHPTVIGAGRADGDVAARELPHVGRGRPVGHPRISAHACRPRPVA